MEKIRRFNYCSYRDGVCGTIVGETAICALRKEFPSDELVWSHGSVIHDQSVFVLTTCPDVDGNQSQFSVTIREVDGEEGQELR